MRSVLDYQNPNLLTAIVPQSDPSQPFRNLAVAAFAFGVLQAILAATIVFFGIRQTFFMPNNSIALYIVAAAFFGVQSLTNIILGFHTRRFDGGAVRRLSICGLFNLLAFFPTAYYLSPSLASPDWIPGENVVGIVVVVSVSGAALLIPGCTLVYFSRKVLKASR